MHQRTRHSHTLLLAAGKGIRVALGLILQMHQLQNVLHAGTDLLAGHIEHMHGKGHVLVHGHAGDQPEILKDDAHLTAQVRDLVAAQLGYVLAQHGHLTGGRQSLPQDQLEQGGFACAGVTQQKDELAFIHMEVDILQRKAATLFIFFGNVFKIDHGIVLAPDIKIFDGQDSPSAANTAKRTGQHRFRAAGSAPAGAKPAQQNISIWPGCWTGTSLPSALP